MNSCRKRRSRRRPTTPSSAAASISTTAHGQGNFTKARRRRFRLRDCSSFLRRRCRRRRNGHLCDLLSWRKSHDPARRPESLPTAAGLLRRMSAADSKTVTIWPSLPACAALGLVTAPLERRRLATKNPTHGDVRMRVASALFHNEAAKLVGPLARSRPVDLTGWWNASRAAISDGSGHISFVRSDFRTQQQKTRSSAHRPTRNF